MIAEATSLGYNGANAMRRIETESDLTTLLGQPESGRLEFKDSRLLDQDKDRVVKQLTEDVSAFANTEGGIIVIGIREGKHGKKSIAVEIDEGVDPARVPQEWLEQIISSNISPPIPGLAVRPVPLSGARAGRVAYVVYVPRGNTAYQARHSLLYYGRMGSAAVPLHDNVIRLLMTRGRVAHAVIEVGVVTRLTADEEHGHRQSQLQDARRAFEEDDILLRPARVATLEAPKRSYDEYTFNLLIRNDGPLTIHECLLSVSVSAPFSVTTRSDIAAAEAPWTFHFNRPIRLRITLPTGERESRPRSLFPEQRSPFPEALFEARVACGGRIPESTMSWTLYLDDAPAVEGSVNLTAELSRAKPACLENPKQAQSEAPSDNPTGEVHAGDRT
jgi:hypothetical protein